MATRYRWFRLKLPDNRPVFSALTSRKFQSGSQQGFLALEESSAAESKHRFLWKTHIPVINVDEQGSAVTQVVEGVDYTDFAMPVVDGVHFLRVEDPGRSVRDLLNALELAIGFGFTAEPVTFTKSRPSNLFASVSASKLTALKVIGAFRGSGVIARMEFASKDGIAPERIDVLADMEYRVESALYEVLFGGLRGQVSFAANGLVRVSSQLGPKLLGLIESDLPLLSE